MRGNGINYRRGIPVPTRHNLFFLQKNCRVACTHLSLPTCITCENYIPASVKMEWGALYGNSYAS
jgi:hypothetical protein